MVTIQVKRSVRLPVEKSILLRAAQMTLDFANTTKNSDVSIVVGNDALLQRLNLKYRNVDSTADVLSFPSGEIDPDTQAYYLGDIVISLTRAQEQSSSEGYALVDELQLLVVHGTLHLLGYDHMETADKVKMQTAQDVILQKLGLKLTSIL
jgi:probable rRNA maturation factor